MVQTHSKPRTSPCKCASVVYTQYSVITGISMLDKSEAIIVSEFLRRPGPRWADRALPYCSVCRSAVARTG